MVYRSTNLPKIATFGFGYGLYIESKYPDLPQIRSSLFIANLDITNGLAWFYRTQFWTFAIIACVFVSQPFGIDLGPTPKGIKAISEIHLAGVVVGEFYSRSWPSLQALISKVFPQDFAASVPATQNDVDTQAWRTRIKGP